MKSLLTLFLFIYVQSFGQVVFVNQLATGSNDGSSWKNAFTYLQDAIFASKSGDEIWVAKGKYYTYQGVGLDLGGCNLSFELKDSVKIYGGFTGSELYLNQRDWELNRTILTSKIDILVNPLATTPTTVVKSWNNSSQTKLDGFIVRDGKVSYCGALAAGGVDCFNSDAFFSNLVISNNYSKSTVSGVLFVAGGMMIRGGFPILNNITIENNTSEQGTSYSIVSVSAGGLGVLGASPKIVNCRVNNNSTENIANETRVRASGGVLCYNSTPQFYNMEISNNLSIAISTFPSDDIMSAGGFLEVGSPILTLQNAVICNNVSMADENGNSVNVFSGGGVLTGNSFIINATISNNTANPIYSFSNHDKLYSAGGVFTLLYGESSLINSIVWNNSATASTSSLDIFSIVNPNTLINPLTVTNCLLDTTTLGTNSIVGQDPLFLFDGSPGLLSDNGVRGDFHLQENTPARNVGNATLITLDNVDVDNDWNFNEFFPVDLQNLPRINACEIDIGAYEFQGRWGDNLVDTSKCIDANSTLLSVEGESAYWFLDNPLTTPSNIGNTFDVGQLGIGEYTYYLSDSTFNCPRQFTDSVRFYVGNGSSLDVSEGTTTLTAITEGVTYQWFDCNTNELLLGETEQSFTPINSGSYSVIITNDFCAAKSNCYSISKPILLFPNPTSGDVKIQLNEFYDDLTVEVVNSLGEIVYYKDYYLTAELNFSLRVANGIYFVRIMKDGESEVVKLIVR